MPTDKKYVLENLIFDQKLKPMEWFATAERLEHSAKILKKHTKNPNNELEVKYQEYMLWGFCLENLFKGILSALSHTAGEANTKKNKKGINTYINSTHILSELAGLIRFKISIDEKLALDFFTNATQYFGRYPSPINSSKLPIYYQDNFDEILNDILVRLRVIITKLNN